jgi:predicted GNAT family acetyltransferase
MNGVRDDLAAQRFELEVDGAVAFAAYRCEGDRIVFTHTVVPPELEGRGIGSRLIAGALARAQAEGLKVVPECEFVAAYLARHPDAADIA